MSAIVLRVRATLRRQWVATIVVAAIIALVSGALLTLVAGARRTASAPDRYTASVGGDLTGLIQQRSGPPLTKAVAALPGVTQVSAYTFTFAGFEDTQYKMPKDLIIFAGTRPLASRLVAGQDLALNRPHGFVADSGFVAAVHAHVGDTFQFVSSSRKQAANGQAFGAEPKGSSFRATLAGIIDSPDRFQGNFTVVTFPASLLDEDVGIVTTEMQVRTVPNVTPSKLRSELDTVAGGNVFDLQAGRVIPTEVRNAVSAQARSVWVMVVVVALGALLALAQLLTRHVRVTDHESRPLAAIGFTSRQLVGERVTRAAVPAVAGIALGAFLAAVASGIFPTGFARTIDPHPGISVDLLAILGVSVALLIGLVGWVTVAVIVGTGSAARRVDPSAGAALADRVPGATASIGTRFALTRRDGTSGGALSGLVLLALLVAVLAGATTFAVSLDRLVTDGGRYGHNYTLMLGDDGSDHSRAELRAKLANDRRIAGMMILTEATARVVGTTANLEVVGIELVKGGLAPRMASGRVPNAADEIALGRVSAASISRHVGDTVRLQGPKGAATYRVVGIAVVPGVAGNDGVGLGSVVTEDGLSRLQAESTTNAAALAIQGPAPRAAVADIARRFGAPDGGTESLPASIVNVRRVRSVPGVLAMLLAGLGLLTLLHILLTSIYARRHDLAIMRALGAPRRWISGAVHWQASVLSAIPVVVGIPLGVLAGGAVFRAFVNEMGAWPDPVVPVVLLVVVGAAIVLVANIAAIIPARRARRLSTADLLRDERR